jgi:O-antigen/teichoic acid export membrane protein
MSHKAANVGKDIGFLAAGVFVAYAGFLTLVAALVIVLAHALPWWVAALVVGIVVAGVGGYLVYQGLQNLKRTNLAPTETLETLKEDAAWTKEAI